MDKKDGMNYAPVGKVNKVVNRGEFIFAIAYMDHGHIFGMANGLIEAGGTLKYIWDRDKEKIKKALEMYPEAAAVDSFEEILDDREVMLVASAAITNERGAIGCKVLRSGKDYFTDKAPFTTLEQIEEAKCAIKETGKKYTVYFSERLHVEAAVHAGDLIKDGAIGDVIQVMGIGPHRLNAKDRPDWFFNKKQYGGILCDIGSHQIEQFLFYGNVKEARVTRAQIGNFNHPEYPELDDFGDCMLLGDNGVTNYFRVDWFTPDGLGTWGDGRMFILGTKGFIELRKYIDIGKSKVGNNIFLSNNEVETYINVEGRIGFPFFGKLILDCLNRTERAMTQEHIFKASELCIKAQMMAEIIK